MQGISPTKIFYFRLIFRIFKGSSELLVVAEYILKNLTYFLVKLRLEEEEGTISFTH